MMPLLHARVPLRGCVCVYAYPHNSCLQASYLHAEAESWAVPLPHSPRAGAVPIAADISVHHAQDVTLSMYGCQLVIATMWATTCSLPTAHARKCCRDEILLLTQRLSLSGMICCRGDEIPSMSTEAARIQTMLYTTALATVDPGRGGRSGSRIH